MITNPANNSVSVGFIAYRTRENALLHAGDAMRRQIIIQRLRQWVRVRQHVFDHGKFGVFVRGESLAADQARAIDRTRILPDILVQLKLEHRS